MKVLIKFIAALLIVAISVIGANTTNEMLISTQAKIAKSYKQKRTERLSFENVEEAKKYVFEKGSKIESIAKDLNIEYLISDDKGAFYNTTLYLDDPLYVVDGWSVYTKTPSEKIFWGANVIDYSDDFSDKSTTELYEYLSIDICENFSEIKEIKENERIQFLYRYVKEIEKQDITYEDFLNNIKETAEKSSLNNTGQYTRLQLAEGLYAAFPTPSYMQVKINAAYKTRVIKQVNPDIKSYFLGVKNSKEAKERVLESHKRHAYNDYVEEIDNYGYEEESIFDFNISPYVGEFKYNTNAYPNLSNGNKIYSIDFSIFINNELPEEEASAINYQKKAYEEASYLYDFIYDIYGGNYPLSKDEFTSKYVKYYLEKNLDIFNNSSTPSGILTISPGVSLTYDGIDFNIPLSFIK